jgi:hypothetical protein
MSEGETREEWRDRRKWETVLQYAYSSPCPLSKPKDAHIGKQGVQRRLRDDSWLAGPSPLPSLPSLSLPCLGLC